MRFCYRRNADIGVKVTSRHFKTSSIPAVNGAICVFIDLKGIMTLLIFNCEGCSDLTCSIKHKQARVVGQKTFVKQLGKNTPKWSNYQIMFLSKAMVTCVFEVVFMSYCPYYK